HCGRCRRSGSRETRVISTVCWKRCCGGRQECRSYCIRPGKLREILFRCGWGRNSENLSAQRNHVVAEPRPRGSGADSETKATASIDAVWHRTAESHACGTG